MGIIQQVTDKFWGNVTSRFWAKVKKTNSCWEWQAAKNKAGYGTLQIYRIHLYAHRVSYELCVGPIPDDKIIMHICDNPSCVNPEHLKIGTQRENMLDMQAKGRHHYPGHSLPKEKNPSAKITAEIAKEIRQSYDPKEGYKKLGQRFGISKSQAYRIIKGQAW